jgi:exodeoxyribonuclease VII small subunit
MAKSGKTDQPESFEKALAELEKIVAAMEAGELSLDQSLANYQRGSELLKYCQAQLTEAQERVRVLEGGELKPFPEDQNQR